MAIPGERTITRPVESEGSSGLFDQHAESLVTRTNKRWLMQQTRNAANPKCRVSLHSMGLSNPPKRKIRHGALAQRAQRGAWFLHLKCGEALEPKDCPAIGVWKGPETDKDQEALRASDSVLKPPEEGNLFRHRTYVTFPQAIRRTFMRHPTWPKMARQSVALARGEDTSSQTAKRNRASSSCQKLPACVASRGIQKKNLTQCRTQSDHNPLNRGSCGMSTAS